jgi:galactokinase
MPEPATVSSAHGRLDILGGIAEFSGSVVLCSRVKPSATVRITPMEEVAVSLSSNAFPSVELDALNTRALFDLKVSEQSLPEVLSDLGLPDWTWIPLGSLKLLLRASQCVLGSGIHVHIESDIPMAHGFCSSASVQIASLKAFAAWLNYRFSGTEIAHLGQSIADFLPNSLCTLADHLACSFVEEGSILPILCRPDFLLPALKFPATTTFAAITTGHPHDSRSPAYIRTRTATFMGKHLFEKAIDRQFLYPSQIAFSYMLHPAFRKLPDSLPGSDFREDDDALNDPISGVLPDVEYPVKECLRFPIMEKRRAESFLELLLKKRFSLTTLETMGELLFQSHDHYNMIGLTHPVADDIVNLIHREGPGKGLYGARVSGHGGTSAISVFLEQRALPYLQRRLNEEMPGLIVIPVQN